MSQNSTIISELYFTNRNIVEYVYAADGRKLREKHTTAVEGLSVAMGSVLQLTPAQTMAVDSMDYAGNLRFTRQRISSSHVFFNLDHHFDGGYLSVTQPNSTSQLCYNLTTHFFIRDHQGRSALCDASQDSLRSRSARRDASNLKNERTSSSGHFKNLRQSDRQ